jgi:hypothetical protein
MNKHSKTSIKALLAVVETLARQHGGHVSILRFTTGWKVLWGTVNLDGPGRRAEVEALPTYGTLREALEGLLACPSKEMPTRRQIGIVHVDSGQLMVCDPGYLDQWDHKEPAFAEDPLRAPFSYEGCCAASSSDAHGGQLHSRTPDGAVFPGIGVVSSTGHGDGIFPVFTEFDAEGLPCRMIVEMRVPPEESGGHPF